MIKEKAYKYKNYQISYDEGLKDRSALVIGIKEKDTLYITGELYDESANAVIKILDNLESQIKLKENIIKEVREYIEKDTRWFDSEYASVYGELCTCKGANSNRLEVLVNPSNILEILDKENK